MPSYITTASTSVILVDTSVLGTGESAVVLLSSLLPPGRNVSIRDSLGYLSTPQSIIVSTTSGILFADGTSSISVSQPYATLTVSSRDATTWNMVNTFGFPSYDTVANVASLTASTILGTSIQLGGSITTSSIYTTTLFVQSTAVIAGPTFVSSLLVGSSTPQPGYTAYIQGNTLVSSNVLVGSNLTVGGAATFRSSVSVVGGLGVGSNLTVGGNMTVSGNFATVGSGSITCQTLQSQSSVNIVGPININSNVIIQSNLTVGGTLQAAALTTSTLIIPTNLGGFLQLASGPILQTRSDILPGNTIPAWNSPLYTPFVSSGTIQASANAVMDTLNVATSISAPTITQCIFGSTIIQNSGGSLITNTIETNTLSLSNSLVTTTLQVSSLMASTVSIEGAILGTNPTTYISAAILTVSSIGTNAISTGNLFAGVIETPAVQVSSLTVYTTFNGGPAFTTMNVPGAVIDNSQGTVITSSIQTNSLQTSTLSIASGNITVNSTLTIVAPNTYINALSVSTVTASTMQTSTLSAARITMGTAPTTVSPYFDVVGGSETNVLVSGGPGDYLTPYFLSNVVPVGQNPAVEYTTAITFNANYQSSPPPPGLVITYSASLFWAGEVQSYMQIAPAGGGPTLYGLDQQNQTVSGTLPISTFQIAATLFGASAISVTFGFQYSANPVQVDSNTLIEFNNGILHWNYAVNGTTIQNSLNDISTRNLFYYGSLNFASDPRIKEDIHDANLQMCYETIRDIPLRRFKYIDSYCSTFNVSQTPRLGFLATDLQACFPKSVHDTVFPEFSTSFMTIDTAQVDMAHLGATKYLMQQVSSLEADLSAIRAALGTSL
jgi:hypothetical protein